MFWAFEPALPNEESGLSVAIFLPLSPFDFAQDDQSRKDFHFNP
ncbi:MAG: hypothetical protein JWQ25_2481 [Daejeonella sp.]|nr:hypothetical protein [Daejeonella sp.]